MRIPRFYCPIPLHTNTSTALPEEVFRHAIQVLRLQLGEEIIVFNGQGGEYLAEINQVAKRSASILVKEFKDEFKESALELTLAQALLKPDKMDFALQKAVELGIRSFQPLITQRSVVRTDKDKDEKRLQHWQAVAISACEQCGRTQIPCIKAPQPLTQYLQSLSQAPNHVLLDPTSTKTLQDVQVSAQKIGVLIGPEGGFTAEEVALCLQTGLQSVHLGSRILRAETASTSVLAILQALYGDLGHGFS